MPVSFSVVIPSYNRGDLIAETLDAILAQTLKPAEIIVVDGASRDNTSAVLDRYEGRITTKIVDMRGASAKRNLGISLAKSEWIALCDSDDLWLPTYLEKQSDLISAEPGIGMAFGNFQILRDQAVEPGTKFDEAPRGFWDGAGARHIPQGWIFDRSFAGASFRFHPIFPSAMVVLKSLAVSVGGFNPDIPRRVEDGEFTLRLLYDLKVAALPEPLVLIRKHASNISGELVPRLLDEVTTLGHIRAHHPQSAPYHHIIADEIGIRTAMAFHAGFAARDHALVSSLFPKLPPARRTIKAHLKNAISRMPDFLGLPLNAALQALTGGGAREFGPAVRDISRLRFALRRNQHCQRKAAMPQWAVSGSGAARAGLDAAA